jgi:hypothetical protein
MTMVSTVEIEVEVVVVVVEWKIWRCVDYYKVVDVENKVAADFDVVIDLIDVLMIVNRELA